MIRWSAAIGVMVAACFAEPPSDADIEQYYSEVNYCANHPTKLECCSGARGELALAASIAPDREPELQWTRVSDAPFAVEKFRRDIPLNLCRGASVEIGLNPTAESSRCNDAWGDEDEQEFVKLELGPEAVTEISIQLSARGLLRAQIGNLAPIAKCLSDPVQGIRLYLGPGMAGLDEVMLARLGVRGADAQHDLARTVWLRDEQRLGLLSRFRGQRYLTVATRGALSSKELVTQVMGACGSATSFDPIDAAFAASRLQPNAAETRLGEVALLAAPSGTARPGEVDILFSSESPKEVGSLRSRSLEYRRRVPYSFDWVAIPILHQARDGAAPLTMVEPRADVRHPAIARPTQGARLAAALARPPSGARVVAYTVGGPYSYLEIARMTESGLKDLHRVTPASLGMRCLALAQPTLVPLEGGYLLYFTCCLTLEHECGTGTGSDVIWHARLNEELELEQTHARGPSPVKFYPDDHIANQRRPVSFEAVATPSGEIHAWLVVQREFQDNEVYLSRSTHAPYDAFDLHANAPVLTADTLCETDDCRVESFAVSLAADPESLLVLVLTSRGAEPSATQELHLLKQPLEVPW